MENDKIAQAEELEAVASIYDKDLQIDDESCRNFSITMKERGREVVLHFTLPPDYPSAKAPEVQLLAPTLTHEQKEVINSALYELRMYHCGETVVFGWTEKIREILQELLTPDDSAAQSLECSPFGFFDDEYEFELPQIIHGETITDRKSSFQAHVAPLFCQDQIKPILHKLYEEKKIANATHNIYAYRIFKDDTCTFLQGCEDDGEKLAGGRLLHLLQMLDLKNIMVVVSRWYGGTLLGPDRFRHINNCARQVLEQGGYIPKK